MTFSKLGTDIQTGQIVELPQASRRQGLYIIGANGTGKSGLIENLILQDIDQGLGVGLLDPHGDLTNAVLAKMTKRLDDVILLDITDKEYPFGLNLFECPDPTDSVEVQKIVDLVMHIFEKLFEVSRATPLTIEYLRNCTHTLIANPGYTMADIRLLLTNDQCRSRLVANVTDPNVQGFWQEYENMKPNERREERSPILRRIDEFLQPLTLPVVGQSKTTVSMQQVMDDRKILLVKLSAQLDQVTSLIGSVIIAQLLNAAYARASTTVHKRKQFNVYADEFQRFATEDFATLLTEARKFGIATTIAHQARYQPGMTDGIRAVSLQAANFVVFRVTSPDANDLAGSFDTSPPPAKQEEAARLPILIFAERVVDELTNKGHSSMNGSIMSLFNKWVRPLTEEKQVRLAGSSLVERAYDVQLNMINRFLVNAMTGRSSIESVEQKKLLADIIISVQERFFNLFSLSTPSVRKPGLESVYPTVEDTIQGVTKLVMSYTNGNFSQSAQKAFWEERKLYWLKHAYTYLYYGDNSSRTAEEIAREQQMQLQRDEHERQLKDIRQPYEDIRVYWDVNHNPPNQYYTGKKTGSMYSPSQMAQKLLQGFDYLDKYVPAYSAAEVSSIVQELYNYLAVWPTPAFLGDPTRTEAERGGAKIYQLTDQIKDFYTEKFTKQEIEWEKWHYQEGTQKALLSGDPVMMERLRQAEAQANQDVYGRDNIPHFVKDMFELATLLCAEPARTESGQYEIKYRPGTVRPYADVKNDIANQLSGLTNYTARVKIGVNTPQNPGKKCLSCGNQNVSGAIYCVGCGTKLPAPNEYIIITLAPGQGLGKTAFDQRIVYIQARNRDPQYGGYCRPRKDVEAEITKRQIACSGSAPAQAQVPQQQPPHARQVPTCPKCGKSNQPGSQFCNQCGAKLI